MKEDFAIEAPVENTAGADETPVENRVDAPVENSADTDEIPVENDFEIDADFDEISVETDADATPPITELDIRMIAAILHDQGTRPCLTRYD